eukprot:CAMPEP_0181181752 /NCGR_PEP_ID=MMETSP1096-20121128/7507_1 /TAXON_ID=156174 ORGANISM="Chrysochromulina ericina, Strain CCMP281" /NCGR_SAMPLE_ID=MMETSP1096 /ASSEMBLY_ACC=CAM_ASM_000453 /LENGTH=156 /DNA_ID=CAMNT_0023270281 /DNA_START=153 /DNA_END=623 /DNA_ORIENTATION=-
MAPLTALVGTIQYMAPEMLNASGAGAGEHSAAVDIYAFAIILWQLLTCSAPFDRELEGFGRVGLLQRIAREGLRPELPPWAPPMLSALIRECWADAEHRRPTSSEVVRRLWQVHHTEFGISSDIASGHPIAGATTPRVAGQFLRVGRRESFPRGHR